jgi:hypothetical protein
MRILWLAFAAVVFASCSTAGTSGIGRLLPHGRGTKTRVRLTPGPCATPTAPSGQTYFETCGRNILISKNGSAPAVFYIKGVDYSPTQIGSTYITPLDDANQAVWSQDLKQMRKLGVNVVKVYNVHMIKNGPANWSVAPMKMWLKAAYNGGNDPIYTILSIGFPAGLIDNPPNAGAVKSLRHQYYVMATTLGANPDVMGISIGDEWNQHPAIRSAGTWTKGVNPIIQAAWQGLIAAGVGNVRILTSTLVDDLSDNSTSTMSEGEIYGFPPSPKPTGPPFNGATAAFAWGFDVYRGNNPAFFGLWSQVKAQTKHPFIVAEWGEPVADHPHPSSSPTEVQEYSSPVPTAITDYIDDGATSLYQHSTIGGSSNVASGGFVFEWSDEYWKAYNGPTPAQACNHIGGNLGTNPNPSPGFPSGFDDEAWFGLNAIALPSSSSSCPPSGSSAAPADQMIPRANFTHLEADWLPEKSVRSAP